MGYQQYILEQFEENGTEIEQKLKELGQRRLESQLNEFKMGSRTVTCINMENNIKFIGNFRKQY